MKKNKILWIVIAVFVVLMIGAYILYSRLSSNVSSDRLMAENPEQGQIEAETEAGSKEGAAETGTEGETAETGALLLAPDFVVTDLEGNEVHLSDFFGKPIVVNFWASWCGPCQSEMGDFNEAYKELGEDIQFLMVNMTDGSRETIETASAYVEEQGYEFPVYYDTQYSAAITYGVTSLPSTYFIGADGSAVARAMGAINRETLQRGIDMID